QWRRVAIRPIQRPTPAALVVCRVTSAPKIEESGHGSRVSRHDAGDLACLTKRERDVLALIGQGLSTAQIAKHLHRSVKTIEWHRVSLGNKLQVTNRVELARIAIRAGICDTEHALVD
ncbi:MAG: response regulator transcription factor, partial [Phycisphaerales bacterium]|nr:response regulator transcription factor [Phycisphaerales bacterium]